MEEAYFSNIKTILIEKISKAQNEVSIAVAWFTNQELLDAITECLNKNIQINLIVIDDYINRNEFSLDFSYFVAKGGHLFFSTNEKLMHNKFCIIDNNLLITGSYNWTYFAEKHNWENIIIIDTPYIIAQYQKEFNIIKEALNEQLMPYTPLTYSTQRTNNIISLDYLFTDLMLKKDKNSYEKLLALVKKDTNIPENVFNSFLQKNVFSLKLKYSLGILCFNNNFGEILKRGEVIPCEKSYDFCNPFSGQEILDNRIVYRDGNNFPFIDALPLTYPKLPQGKSKETITFKIRNDKKLYVTIYNHYSQKNIFKEYPISISNLLE